MSLILEALKKSEQQRRLGEAPHFGSPVVATRRRRNLLPVLAILILIAAAAGWWLMRRSPSPAPSASTPADVARSVAQTPIKRDAPAAPSAANRTSDRARQPGASAALQKNEQEKRAAALGNAAHATPPMPAPVAMPPKSAAAATAPTTSASTPAPPTPPADKTAGLHATAPPPSAAAPPTPATQKADATIPAAPPADAKSAAATAPATKPPAPGAALPTIWDLPFATRKDIPALDLSMHVYSSDPKQRFVVLKGDRHVEGDEVAPDLVLREIRQDGLVLEYKGQKFFFPRAGR